MENKQDLKRRNILESALTVFSRYGYKRTTMRDIAEEARMSRAAIYLHFKNKEEVFRSLALKVHEETVAKMKGALELEASFETRLLTAFRFKFEAFGSIFGSLHGEELIALSIRALADLAGKAKVDYFAVLTTFFEQAEAKGEIDLSPLNVSPATYADMLIKSSYGLKADKPTIDQMQERLETLVGIFVKAVTTLPTTGA